MFWNHKLREYKASLKKCSQKIQYLNVNTLRSPYVKNSTQKTLNANLSAHCFNSYITLKFLLFVYVLLREF